MLQTLFMDRLVTRLLGDNWELKEGQRRRQRERHYACKMRSNYNTAIELVCAF